MNVGGEREQLIRAADYRCQCDNEAGRAECGKAHAALGRRCTNGAFVLATEPDGRKVVLCHDCDEDRAKAPGRRARADKKARAAKYAAAQTSLLDLLSEGN